MRRRGYRKGEGEREGEAKIKVRYSAPSMLPRKQDFGRLLAASSLKACAFEASDSCSYPFVAVWRKCIRNFLTSFASCFFFTIQVSPRLRPHYVAMEFGKI